MNTDEIFPDVDQLAEDIAADNQERETQAEEVAP